MAFSDEEKDLRDQTRTALLKAIKAEAELMLDAIGERNSVKGEDLRHLAEAYEIAVSTERPPARMRSF